MSVGMRPLRVIEFFAGMGGWRRALGRGAVLAAAYDISPPALATYARLWGERPIARELATLPAAELLRHGADTWVMSPPCQPFCRMGHRKDLEDPRSRAFVHLMDLLAEHPPERLALESVVGFLGSDAHALLAARLREGGFQAREYTLDPMRFGLPNLRPRVFVVASRRGLADRAVPDLPPAPLRGFLDSVEDPGLYLGEALRHRPGLDLVTADATRTACFIGGYGRRFVGSGSFLETERGVRRFSVAETARLLGWDPVPAFPEEVNAEGRYKLLGNGLSIPVAAWVLAQVSGPPQLSLPKPSDSHSK
ncbi:DNA cytosine methyltransferase [Mesoterricola silvestris]|uniref:DNA (cytosine-5-)-methyltransferase n=1 Tax=Mesoterricola silvestris TaxID=2927979 RepID=A0AA48K9C7_9BACT|nr:DNA cytosine methyltransferase [Mesoterricola silvestris]BDU73311.1 DNA methyltransferase [Mesoterricola silvestris]